MTLAVLLLLGLFWSLAHSQRVPYVSFMSQTLPNHSYVNLSQVGRPDSGGGEGVQCITDLATCCTSTDGSHRGDWYFPNSTRVPFNAPNIDTYETRVSQGVDLRRTSGVNSSTVGIYRLMELDCLLLHLMLIPLRFIYLRELTYVVTMVPTHQRLVSIAVIF